MTRRALICGISGQDGAYLAKLLLEKGYEVWGTSRDTSTNDFAALKFLGILRNVNLKSMSPQDFGSVLTTFSDVMPQEIYNLAGQSSVALSFEDPLETIASISAGTLNQLEAIRLLDSTIRFFNAGSGEVFGNSDEKELTEASSFRPCSPYGVAKVSSAMHAALYRDIYDIYACTGFLFNHESPLRSERFVTKKIVAAANRIARGSKEKLNLGNIDIVRDWGWAPDYVDAMWRTLDQKNAGDYVIATGVALSLTDFIAAAFEEANLNWREHVVLDPTLRRPSDPKIVKVNPAKAEKILSWKATCSGSEVAKRMYRAIA